MVNLLLFFYRHHSDFEATLLTPPLAIQAATPLRNSQQRNVFTKAAAGKLLLLSRSRYTNTRFLSPAAAVAILQLLQGRVDLHTSLQKASKLLVGS